MLSDAPSLLLAQIAALVPSDDSAESQWLRANLRWLTVQWLAQPSVQSQFRRFALGEHERLRQQTRDQLQEIWR